MALTTTLNKKRCISFKKEKISPENSMTFADLSNVQSTADLINEIIDYSIKNPHFLNQIAYYMHQKQLVKSGHVIEKISKSMFYKFNIIITHIICYM